MEKSKFLDAKLQYEIIEACKLVLIDNEKNEISKIYKADPKLVIKHIIELIFIDDKITESFLWWVGREKFIAEDKFNKLT